MTENTYKYILRYKYKYMKSKSRLMKAIYFGNLCHYSFRMMERMYMYVNQKEIEIDELKKQLSTPPKSQE
jgi:hypothetical protein